MLTCENCGKEHDGSYGSGRFCCEKCSKSFSSSKSRTTVWYKKSHCSCCGKEILINKRSSVNRNNKCRECQHIKIKRCKMCGREYVVGMGCENEFCKKHNLQQIKTLIKYFGFDDAKLGTESVENEFNRIRNILYDLYWNKGFSSTDLAKVFNYKSDPTNITQKFFKVYLDIPVKSLSYSTIENFESGKLGNQEINTQYNCGWHNTWNGKEVYLRSSYELDYAKELDEKKIDYDVECLRIKYFDTTNEMYRCSVPDFYLPETNTIVEIKSNWTLNIKEMIDKRKAYLEKGYKFKLILEHKETDLDKLDA